MLYKLKYQRVIIIQQTLVIIVLLVIYWIFRPNSGNYHLRDKEQEIEDLAQDIWRNNRGISYSEAYQRAIEQYQETNKNN